MSSKTTSILLLTMLFGSVGACADSEWYICGTSLGATCSTADDSEPCRYGNELGGPYDNVTECEAALATSGVLCDEYRDNGLTDEDHVQYCQGARMSSCVGNSMEDNSSCYLLAIEGVEAMCPYCTGEVVEDPIEGECGEYHDNGLADFQLIAQCMSAYSYSCAGQQEGVDLSCANLAGMGAEFRAMCPYCN